MKSLLLFLLTLTYLWAEQRIQVHMGTFISVKTQKLEDSDAVFELFKKLDNTLSSYKENSEISLLNTKGSLKVSPLTATLLQRSLELSKLSGGAFDVTIGALSHGVYGFGSDAHLATQKEIAQGLKHIGKNKLFLKKEIAYLKQGTLLDLGGIAKGYGVDLAIKILQNKGVKKAVVAASGDIGCIAECKVAIQDPFHSQKTLFTLHSSWLRFAVSTSGNYEQYVYNKTHNHLLNPQTGQSEQIFASVTLFAKEDNTKLDALATAVAIMSLSQALTLLEKEKIAYVLVLNNGKIYKSLMPKGISL